MSRRRAVKPLDCRRLALALAVATCGAGCPRESTTDATPEPKKSAKVHKKKTDGVRTYRDFALGREPYGIDPIGGAEAKGRWHYRVSSRAAVVTDIEHVSPSGHVTWRYGYAREGGTLTVREREGYDVEAATTEVATDGTTTRTARSGIVGNHGCHHQKVDYDDEGLVQKVRCLDGDGKAVANDVGCEVLKLHYDADRRVDRQWCLHADGTPATFAEGEHELRDRFDAQGRVIETTWLGAEGKPFVAKDGTTTKTWAWDDAGDLIGESQLDARKKTVSALRRVYDENGCRAREENLDKDGVRTARNGIGLWIFRRDSVCGITYSETRGALDELVGEPPIHEYTLDREGLAREERCRDAHSAPISCESARGTAGALVTYDRDARGRPLRRSGFTTTGTPSALSNEYPHERRNRYDADGRVESAAYFDETGAPAVALGMHEVRFSYDSVGAELSRSFLGKKGEKLATTLGCHEIRTVYDDHHQLAARECRDVDGALHNSSMCFWYVCWKGAARVSVVRAGAMTTNELTTESGAHVATLSCETERCYR